MPHHKDAKERYNKLQELRQHGLALGRGRSMDESLIDFQSPILLAATKTKLMP